MQVSDPCAEPAKSISLDAALARICGSLAPLAEIEHVPLEAALSRILAEDVLAPFDLPPFPSSAMDGYALRREDLLYEGETKLDVIGTSFAGRPFFGRLAPGQCVRIFTGAAIPEGADAVAIQEDAIRERDTVRLHRTLSPQANIRPAGDEIRGGELMLRRGQRLGPAELGLLASAGFPTVPASRLLRVAFFSTGDELRGIGERLEYGQIHDSNRYMLRGLLSDPAIDILDLGVAPDDPVAIRAFLLDASQRADVILTSGGVSVGEADFVTGCLAKVGKVDFWKVAIKPGKPFAFGRVGPAWFFGLPGNPVAVMVTFRQLVRPALSLLIGTEPKPPLRLKATCLTLLRKAPGRMEFQRGIYAPDGAGGLSVSGFQGQGSHQLLGVSRANCFIVLPESNAGVKPGDAVEIEPILPGLG